MQKEAHIQEEYVPEAQSREQLLFSPPVSSSEGLKGGKLKKRATVTPRTFTRFFTPRSSFSKRGPSSYSRHALRDITSPAVNRHTNSSSRKRLNLEPFPDISPLGDENEWSRPVGVKRRKIPVSPDTTVDGSSPIKRNRGASPFISESPSRHRISRAPSTDFEESDSDTGRAHEADVVTKPRISRRIWSGLPGRILGRSLSNGQDIQSVGIVDDCAYWQSETANFYSRPGDSHLCANTASEGQALPFCTAGCNTNTLVAIGDEEGGVRLLESARDGKPSFSTAYLTFRPHYNAILDLTFSSDDMLLATASGDQTVQIIDMPTQRPIFTMAGHGSSVKQVRFQPGSNDNVVATSSRDGSIQVWDLRCKGFKGPVRDIRVSLEPTQSQAGGSQSLERMGWVRSVNSIVAAHAIRESVLSATNALSSSGGVATDAPSKSESPGRRGDVSVTALAFLPPGREHLLLTASEANASVKLWDLRTAHCHRRARAKPLSSTRQPQSHDRHRQFGLTSLNLSGDGARLYTLCRDSSVYAYSTSHLILGHAPELSSAVSRPRRSGGLEKEGLGPMYGFRHPRFHATTFYVKSSLRPALDDRSELLSVGSSDGNAVLFPTDERYMKRQSATSDENHMGLSTSSQSKRPPLSRTGSGAGLPTRAEDAISIYQHGTALVRGHSKEVTALTWTYDGSLVTVGDDFVARCWREGPDARDLRIGGEKDGRRWGCGWAEVEGPWDEDD